MDIVTKTEGQVAWIILNRQQSYNALDKATAQALHAAVKAANGDKAVKCIILTSMGKAFCCGVDLKIIEQNKEQDTFDTSVYRDIRDEYGTAFKDILYYLHEAIHDLHQSPKPVIAGVRGIAAAGGIGLALACDLVYAAPTSSFEWAYWKTALTSAEGSTYSLPRLVGLQKAKELAFLSPRMSAEQAKDLGLVTAIVPEDSFDSHLRDVATRLAAVPEETLMVTKKLLNRSLASKDIRTHLDIEFREIGEIIKTDNFYEGIRAFVEKRPARFDTQPDQS